jgi:hypothetical protein
MQSEYKDLPGLNWSSLKHMARSPLHYRHRTLHPEPRTSALDVGVASHLAVFEPEKLGARFASYAGKRDARTKAYQTWVDENPGVTALRPAEYQTAVAIGAAVRAHPVAAYMLKDGEPEARLEWTVDGIKAKGRVDFLRSDRIVDLKTTTSIAEREVGNACARYLYHVQLAWYHDGAVASGRIPADALPPVIISVEKDAPHDVAVDALDANDLWLGREAYRMLLERLRVCAETGYWPGAAPELRTLRLPAWGDIAAAEAAEEVF